MNRERWEEIDRVFALALERPPAERAAFLDKACNSDEELRREVESLLAHDQSQSFMEVSASREAARLVVKDATQPFAGGTVGHYKVLKKLGAGGMGEVFLAHDTRLNRSVALKLLSIHLTEDEERVRRFRQEALAASALNHPNILTIYEIEQHGNRPYIATEFVNGVTLRTRMRSKRLSLADALDITLQIAGALSAAHDAGIVHRDIKPENIMVRPDGLVKILDFGIAKYTQSTRSHDAKQEWIKTATGVVIGTTAYMSPEQARGVAVDGCTDIWSLGVILYEMIGRCLPFTGATPTDRVAAILEREPEPLGKRRRGVPPALEKIVNRCLAKNCHDRYAQAMKLVNELREVRASLGDEPRRSFSLPRLVQGIPRLSHRQAVGALVTVLLIAVIVGWVGYLISRNGRDAKQTIDASLAVPTIDSLAVVPLANVGGSADTEYLADGITESLINHLSQLPSLKVMSRNSVFRYKGKEVEAGAVANALHVRAVLMGRVTQRGDDLDVSIELVDARDNSHVWGEQYKRTMTELVALQSDIARDVSQKLRMKLSSTDQQRLAKNYTQNSEAYKLYLKGRYHMIRLTPSENQKAISYFRQAIEIDPSYALAYVGLADAYRALPISADVPPIELFPKAKATVQKALEIDEGLAEAHAVLGFTIFWYEWNWNEAENQYKRALELNPNDPNTHLYYAHLLSETGRHTEALTEIKRALVLDPLSIYATALEGQFLLHAGQVDDALAQLQKAFELAPDYWLAHLFASSAYIEKGMYKEAVAEALKSRDKMPESSHATAFFAYALAKSGKRAEATRVLEELLKSSTERFVPAYTIAMVYNGLDERDQSLAWLEKGYQQRDPRMVFLKVEPKWNNLRDDARFQDLLQRMGF